MGFNTIILLASWSEFEPTIGTPSNDAYNKINKIIDGARAHDLQVTIRVPYLWSLSGTEIAERLAYALVSHKDYRRTLLQFLQDFHTRVIAKNSNVISQFGSWEDFYIVRDIFFAGDSAASAIVRRRFSAETGISPEAVQRDGRNYDRFLNWVDALIADLSHDIGNYGYEIRTDSDPLTIDGQVAWHSHSAYYANRSGGDVVAYWAPYFGQQNAGETISSQMAIRSFAWMLDAIGEKTDRLPFIDQLNFYDNSPGTERNAKIDDMEYTAFFNGLIDVLANRTNGYAFWTIRDYSHNLIYNPSFALGLMGWTASEGASTESGYLTLGTDHSASQTLPKERGKLLKSGKAKLAVSVVSGVGSAEINDRHIRRIEGPGRHEFEVETGFGLEDVRVTIRNETESGNPLVIEWVGVFGHTQFGRVQSPGGERDVFFPLIVDFNHSMSKVADQLCRGFQSVSGDSNIWARGLFPDGWSATRIELCFTEYGSASGVEIAFSNLSPERRMDVTIHGSSVVSRHALSGDSRVITLCPAGGIEPTTAVITFAPPFVPKEHSSESQDERPLGAFVKAVGRSSTCPSRE